jgi:hypothetical protein
LEYFLWEFVALPIKQPPGTGWILTNLGDKQWSGPLRLPRDS